MPEFNLIQRPDLILRLQQMLGLRQAHVTPSLSETVSPVVIMGDVRDTGGERQIVRTAWGSVAQSPAVGLNSQTMLLNPVGSRAIVTIRTIKVGNRTAAAPQQFSIGITGPGAGPYTTPAPIPPMFRNSRAVDPFSQGALGVPLNVPSATLSSRNTAGFEPQDFVLQSPGTDQVECLEEIVILPGWACVVVNDTGVNNGINASFSWEEEDLEQRG